MDYIVVCPDCGIWIDLKTRCSHGITMEDHRYKDGWLVPFHHVPGTPIPCDGTNQFAYLYPTEDNVAATLLILVGAEGVAELKLDQDGAVPGVRKANEEEIAAFRESLEPLVKEQREKGMNVSVSNYFVDGMGRPYWVLALDDDAPPAFREKAEKFKRVMRLTD